MDVFIFSEYFDDLKCFCVNWNLLGVYDYKKKVFLKLIFFFIKIYFFEGLEVIGMNDFKVYLEIEYGYLGWGVMYDCKI